MNNLKLQLLKEEFTIHQFNPEIKIPLEKLSGDNFWIGKTKDELSIVCDSTIDLKSNKQEKNWSALKIVGPLSFDQIGIIAEISSCLATEKIPIFVISAFETDYILIKKSKINQAVKTLNLQGYSVNS